MVGILNRSLNAMPGDSLKQKVDRLAKYLGMKPRRIDDFRWGLAIQPSAEEYVNLLKRADRIRALEAEQAAVLREIEQLRKRHAHPVSAAVAGQPLDAAAVAGGSDYRARGAAERAIPATAGEGTEDRSRELLTLCGSVDLVETLPLSAASGAQAAALQVAAEAGGFLTPPVIDQLTRSGLAPLASVFGAGEQLPLLSMGSGTRFWSDAQRQRMTGAPFDSIPAPAAFKRVVSAQLADVRSSARPTLTRIIAVCGTLRVDYLTLRVLDQASGCILALPQITEVGAAA